MKQAPQAWYERYTSTLTSFGFVHNKCDPSLLVLHTTAGCIYVLIYVDDIILTSSSLSLLQTVISKLNSVFALKQPCDLDYFLGIEVKRYFNGSLLLSQSKYIRDLLAKADMIDAKGISTPLQGGLKLSKLGSTIWMILFFIILLWVLYNILLLHGLK